MADTFKPVAKKETIHAKQKKEIHFDEKTTTEQKHGDKFTGKVQKTAKNNIFIKETNNRTGSIFQHKKKKPKGNFLTNTAKSAVYKGAHKVQNRLVQPTGYDAKEAGDSNLGFKTAQETKKAAITSKNTAKGIVKTGKTVAKTAKTTVKVVKKTGQVTKKAAQVVQKSAQAAQAAIRTGITAVKAAVVAAKSVGSALAAVFSHPISWFILLFVAIVVLVIVLIVSIFGAIMPTMANTRELMDKEQYSYIATLLTTKDAELLEEFTHFGEKEEYSQFNTEDIEYVKNIVPATSVITMANYLWAKYDDKIANIFVFAEVAQIHPRLYTISTEIYTKEVTTTTSVIDKNGKPLKDKNGNPLIKTVTETKEILKVVLDGVSLADFIDEHLLELMPQEADREMYLFLLENSGNAYDGEFGPPFSFSDWRMKITQQMGEIGPLDGKPHRGMDIAYPEGTPALTVISGAVIDTGTHVSWGNYVIVLSTDGKYRVRYAHLSTIGVSLLQNISVGDVIGGVGNTGMSTGSHLHIELEEDGVLVNPTEYLP